MHISPVETTRYRSQRLLLFSSVLLILAFATAFFSRFLEQFGAPSLINFVHFAAVPMASCIAVVSTKMNDRRQIAISYALLLGMLLFLLVEVASAFLNSAGIVNIVLDMLLLVEPFVLLLAIVSFPVSVSGLKRLRSWFEGFVFMHLLLIYVQKFALRYCDRPGDCDNVQGIFYHSGSGHVVGASVSASFAIYYFATAKERPLWLRMLVLVAGFGNILTSDAKQVLLTFMVACALLIFTKKSIVKSLSYFVGLTLFGSLFWWAIQNVEALSAFNTWMRPEIYGPQGEATLLKLSGIRITLDNFYHPLNWLLGLGPGHTIDRLGGWMLRDYNSLLAPLGATRTTIGPETWQYVSESWLAEGSSMFAPFWGWAAIWGDLGFLGLAAYLYLASVVWRWLCLDDMSRLLLLTVMVHGFIFTQLEEPSYMLAIAMMIGIRWYQQMLIQKYPQLVPKKIKPKRLPQLLPPTEPVIIP